MLEKWQDEKLEAISTKKIYKCWSKRPGASKFVCTHIVSHTVSFPPSPILGRKAISKRDQKNISYKIDILLSINTLR